MENIAPIMAAITGLLVVFGGGIRWMIVRMDANAAANAKREDEARFAAALREEMARNALSDRLQAEIKQLQTEVNQLREISARLTMKNDIFYKRIVHLETFIQSHSMKLPETEGWPAP